MLELKKSMATEDTEGTERKRQSVGWMQALLAPQSTTRLIRALPRSVRWITLRSIHPTIGHCIDEHLFSVFSVFSVTSVAN